MVWFDRLTMIGKQPFVLSWNLRRCEINLNIVKKPPEQTRRGHWKRLVPEPFGCEAPRYTNFAGLHSW